MVSGSPWPACSGSGRRAFRRLALSVIRARAYRGGMPAGNVGTDRQPRELYTQALAARKQAHALAAELHAIHDRTRVNWQLIQDAWNQTEQIRARRLAASAHPDWLRHSAYARLRARLSSMPVIEQAKGIIMARYGCPEDEAFEALRRASQRENVKVRDLAARIVARTARAAAAQRQAGPASTTTQSGDEFIPRAGTSRSRDRYRASA